METKEKFNLLSERVEKLEETVENLTEIIKSLANAAFHNHNWKQTGYHCDENVERKCTICDLHEKYIYPMIPYENRWEKM